ncbi:MAG: hypothetical protein ACR2NP_11315 [Pirellulaceae bacterium]
MNSSEDSIPMSQFGDSAPLAIHLTTWQDQPCLLAVRGDGHLVCGSLTESEMADVSDLSGVIDLKEPISIYARQPWVAVVNSKGLRGIVLNLDDPSWKMPLQREDYHSKNCSFPLAFIERDGRPLLIHSTKWNRLDITDLETGECLTGRVIQTSRDANERINYRDYFHSLLHTSPDTKSFVSNGWVWSPFDQIVSWTVEGFLAEYEPVGKSLTKLDVTGYNWDRPCCFVDNETIAFGYNVREECESTIPDDQKSELIFQNIHSAEIIRRVEFHYFHLSKFGEVVGTLYFDVARRQFVAVTRDLGTTLTDEHGKQLARWNKPADAVNTDQALLAFIEDDQVRVVGW